jgi:uncharacterized membrane protein
MTKPLLDQTPDHRSLKVLRDAGVISPASFWAGIRQMNDPQEWARWAARLCMVLGSALVLAAVVYFFAFNWDALERMQKLGLLQALTLGALGAGQWVGFRRLGGQLLLMAAAIFVGVSFAVFGQVYQTGADAFGFFGIWALCILPWVLAGAFAPLWVLWFVLVNLTVWLFWNQVGQFNSLLHYSYICIPLTVLNGAGLLLRERLATRYEWLRGRWLRPLFLLGALTPLLIPALDLIVDSSAGGGYAMFVGSVIWMLCLGVTYLYFTRCQFDSTALCIVLGNAALYLITAIGRMLEEADLFDDGAGFFLMALVIVGVTALLVWWLRELSQRHGSTAGSLQ